MSATADLIARVRESLEGITKGPWKLGNRRYPAVVHTPRGCLWHPDLGFINHGPDGEFIAAARSFVPEMLAAIESVDALATKWENATNMSDGQPNIVARAFADDLRRALEVTTLTDARFVYVKLPKPDDVGPYGPVWSMQGRFNGPIGTVQYRPETGRIEIRDDYERDYAPADIARDAAVLLAAVRASEVAS